MHVAYPGSLSKFANALVHVGRGYSTGSFHVSTKE